MKAERFLIRSQGMILILAVLFSSAMFNLGSQAGVAAGIQLELPPGAVLPAQPLAITDQAAAIAAGGSHTCALTAVGGVKCWGYNGYGQLGDGTTTRRTIPVDVSLLTSGVNAISTGGNHTCALTVSGGVKCWGYNGDGQLGDGTQDNRNMPVNVSGLTTGVSAIAAGGDHTCALTISGGVKCWGGNWSGQLGDDTNATRTTPVDVIGLSSGVSAIVAGGNHTCALTDSGGVKCWGDNWPGQLGDGTNTTRRTPVDVSGLSSGVSSIAAGGEHTCALTASGGVKCWGYNEWGQLGDSTWDNRNTPVDVIGLSNGVSAIDAGWSHTCALTTSGGVWCWGENDEGQLGDGRTSELPRNTPVDVSGLSSGVHAIAAGGDHTCALTSSGGVKCWGSNWSGELGDGTVTAEQDTPVDVSGLSSGVSAIDAGGYHVCALTASGGARCWGSNRYGKLGDGTTIARFSPVEVIGLSSWVSAIAAGGGHTCALTETGGVKCWGRNNYGQLGNGTTNEQHTPADVSGLTSGVSAIAAGGSHTCALTDSGGVKCWGRNNHGQLGDGTTDDHYTPVDVFGISSGVSAISAGDTHTCALTSSGGVKCWGSNGSGQLGDGTTNEQHTPVDVFGLSSGVSAISAGDTHTCAVTASGGAKCWGDNESGELGDGTSGWGNYSPTPVDVSGLTSGASAISAGSAIEDRHTCALTVSGGVKCWGSNFYGQLGDGTWTERHTPVDVSGLSSGVSAISAGDYFTCALTQAGGVKCWGDNWYGQLGSGISPLIPHWVVGFEGLLNKVFTPLIIR